MNMVKTVNELIDELMKITIRKGSTFVREEIKNVGLLELSGLLEEIFNNILSV